MRKLLSLIVLAGLAGASPAGAIDVPEGADTLRLLARNAQLIVKVTAPAEEVGASLADVPAQGRRTLKFKTYRVTVSEVVKGPAQAGQALRVALPASLDVASVDSLFNALLFLRPASAAQLNAGDLPHGEGVFIVVSGRLGAVKAESPELLPAVRAYVRQADAPAGAVSWAETYVRSRDPFLQRSAIRDLYDQRDRSRAFNLLSDIVGSSAILPINRTIAIEALQETGRADARPPLKEVAENVTEPAGLREAAIRAFSNLPGANMQIREWRRSEDRLLSATAAIVGNGTAEASHGPE